MRDEGAVNVGYKQADHRNTAPLDAISTDSMNVPSNAKATDPLPIFMLIYFVVSPSDRQSQSALRKAAGPHNPLRRVIHSAT
jgi:hypothetical protein